MDNQYNYIYEKLVTSEDDVLGLIAYGMYKQHKIEFISKIKEDNNRESQRNMNIIRSLPLRQRKVN